MKYVDEFRDGELARGLAARIAAEVRPARRYHFMEFCGGHTHAITRYGVKDLLPSKVLMVHGPGCPVCVLPIGRLDQAIALARRPGVTLCTYGDMIRVPGKDRVSLLRARAEGAVRHRRGARRPLRRRRLRPHAGGAPRAQAAPARRPHRHRVRHGRGLRVRQRGTCGDRSRRGVPRSGP